jgi:phosphohistidine phosphatase
VEFFLARHGEAVGELIDPNRPLSLSGRQGIERVAREAAQKPVAVSVIYHSGILRAEQTAAIFATHFTPAEGAKLLLGLRPDDDPSFAAAELDASERPVMLVGHLPHLGRLSSLLTHGSPDTATISFQPATVACYTRAGKLWKIKWIINP